MHPIIGPSAGTAPQSAAGRPARWRNPAPGHAFHLWVFNIKATNSLGSASRLLPTAPPDGGWAGAGGEGAERL